jgi:hypothetical protein
MSESKHSIDAYVLQVGTAGLTQIPMHVWRCLSTMT